MRTIETTVFKFSKLSEEAKKKKQSKNGISKDKLQ